MGEHIVAAVRARAGNQVEYAGGNHVLGQTGELQHAQGGDRGGLEHGAAAAGQHGGQFPGRHQEREVPGYDLSYHANGLVEDQREGVVAQHIGRSLVRQDTAGKVAEVGGGVGNDQWP